MVSVPYRGATFLNSRSFALSPPGSTVSVPYRGATFLNHCKIEDVIEYKFPSPIGELHFSIMHSKLFGHLRRLFPSPIGELHFSMLQDLHPDLRQPHCFRPLSGSYISQYHPRNPMFCLGQIGGLRGKSNFIEMQPFWKVKNSHKSSI